MGACFKAHLQLLGELAVAGAQSAIGLRLEKLSVAQGWPV
jgi:hypothetical protein